MVFRLSGVVVIAKQHEDMEFYGSKNILVSKPWLPIVKLDLQKEKTKVFVVSDMTM